MDIELADLLTALRSEIGRARLEGAGKDVRFRIDSIDLELQVAVEKTAQATGGVRFWVVSLGGGGSARSAETHTVRLSLTAQTDTGDPVLTGDDIAGLFPAQ